MARAWLILLSFLVILLLFLSLILFYLYPLKHEQPINTSVSFEEDISFNHSSGHKIDVNSTIIWENFMRISKKNWEEEFVPRDIFVDVPLDKSLAALGAKKGDPIFVRIFKEESRLEVWIRPKSEYVLLKEYVICAYSGDLGPKLKEGDKQSPEGFYKVKTHLLNPKSKFHLSFNLGYPNVFDRAHRRTGSFLMVHGNCVSIGCYAMTDSKIEEIYALVEGALKKGQKYVQVHAFPFRMTDENMAIYSEHHWYDFWVNLKDGYDYFEAEKLPPLIKVKNKSYIIHEASE